MFRPRLPMRLLRRPLLARPLALPAAVVVAARRCIHGLPKLPHDYSNGVPDLLSPDGFRLAWTDYMAFLLERLNEITTGTELDDMDTKTLSLLSAREPGRAALFNYASMAHNTHFFFQGIAPGGTPMPDALCRELIASFSSIETLRREFVLTAAAMFGPGFLWLVRAGPGHYRLLPTYLAGSPYPGAHWRAQSTDMSALGNDGSARSYVRKQATAYRRRGNELPPGGVNVEPLLCLNTWEHTWLMDWGVGVGGHGGKLAFAESWWNKIDWEKVASRAGVPRPDFKSVDTE